MTGRMKSKFREGSKYIFSQNIRLAMFFSDALGVRLRNILVA